MLRKHCSSCSNRIKMYTAIQLLHMESVLQWWLLLQLSMHAAVGLL